MLSGLEKGRRSAIQRKRREAAPVELAVRRELDLDILGGRPARGRSGRIALALRGKVTIYVGENDVRDQITPRGVAKILERLSRRSD